MESDPRLDAVWHVEECNDELAKFCACIVAARIDGRIQYVTSAETPELASRLAADHNDVTALREQLVERDEQIAGLLADVPDLSDDQAGVPV